MKKAKHKTVAYADLTPTQRADIWHGDACGHPTNRPKDDAAAHRLRWEVDLATGKVTGFVNYHALASFFPARVRR